MKKDIKILFFSCTARAFRTTLVGHLYEITKNFPVVLLSEKLDEETEKIIQDKNKFPKLEKIVQVDVINSSKLELFSRRNRNFYKLAKQIFEQEKPDIVITSSDTHSLFEIYLNRLGKRYGAINVVLEATCQVTDIKKLAKWFDLSNAYLRFPSFLPMNLKILLVGFRKFFGHFLYYWIFPLTIGEKPFWGKASHILRIGNSGMRDSDYQLVFSKRDYNIHLKDGVFAKKLYILPHPLETNTRDFLKNNFINKTDNYVNKKFILLVLPDIEIGFKDNGYSLIPKNQRIDEWVDICDLVAKTFPEHDILLKPHPNTDPFIKDLEDSLLKLNNERIKIVDGQNPVDKYIETSDMIIGLPVSISTTLFTAHIQCPDKRIISINFDEELLGNHYKDFEGIEYIDDKKKFIQRLHEIKEQGFLCVHSKIGLKDNVIVDLLIKFLKDKNTI